ncbi:hypothetical protein CRUP_033409, partial [Coryphaenoides rupestris]
MATPRAPTGSSRALLMLQVLGWLSPSLACFCENYPWSSWNFVYDTYFWKNSCQQFCEKSDQRACNLRMRYVLRPAQFGGAACSEVLVDEQPCYPETACRLPEVDCRQQFKCTN